METLRAEVEKFKGGNITVLKMGKYYTRSVCFKYIAKFCLTMEFAQVQVHQFVPPLNFFPVETEIIDTEIFKVLSKCVIVNTTREPNNYVSSIRGPKKMVIME